jgi:GNAT superfamily N-acetyltransferase
MLIDDLYFSLEFRSSGCLLDGEEPSEYLYLTRGKIVALDEYGKKMSTGRFQVYYVDVGAALNAGTDIFDVFDSHSSTVGFFDAIFNPETLDLSDKLDKLFKNSYGWGNVLILDRLEVLPEFRGKNLGLVVMRRLIERFGAGAYVVGIKPFPLQGEGSRSEEDPWRSRLLLNSFDDDLKRSTKKLREYYAKLGFKAMRGTPFMFRLAEEPFSQLKIKR